MHKGLQFRHELETDLSADKTVLTRRFGNVTADTMFTFEYGMKPISQLLKIEDLDMATITHIPFQTSNLWYLDKLCQAALKQCLRNPSPLFSNG